MLPQEHPSFLLNGCIYNFSKFLAVIAAYPDLRTRSEGDFNGLTKTDIV